MDPARRKRSQERGALASTGPPAPHVDDDPGIAGQLVRQRRGRSTSWSTMDPQPTRGRRYEELPFAAASRMALMISSKGPALE